MCGDNPPKPTDVIDISERAQLIKLCFNKEHSLHSNKRYGHQLPRIVWILEPRKAISIWKQLKRTILNDLTVQPMIFL